ncbi:MAG: hypothetical protein HQ509_09130 [Candidatus Marinimicrobia bacterium]|nr:hypothetical protein [Candidatus Neomarinimicrobiota bacterium]
MKKIITPILLILFSFSSTTFADEILIFSPSPNETVLKTDVLIAASFFDLGGVSTDRVHLFFDEIEITDRAEIDSDMLSYAPSLINPGSHTVRILIRRDGLDPLEKRWSFTVAGQKKWTDELEWSGKTSANYRIDKMESGELSVGTVGVFFRGTAYNWLRFKTNLNQASDEDPLIQPRSRYTFQMSLSRFLDLSFGDANPRLSRFTIDGKRMRGFEANLKLNAINFHFIKGDLVRDINGSLDPDESYDISKMALEGDTTFIELNRKGYTFRQELTGGRLSFGAGKYFQWGFSLMKVKDDINSVIPEMMDAKIRIGENAFGLPENDYTLEDLLMFTSNDSGFKNVINLKDPTDWTGVAPQDNIVLGTDMGMYLDNKRILLEGEVAFSLYNKDIWDGAITKAGLDTMMDDTADGFLAGSMDLETIPFDPKDYEDFFVIGIGMIPLVPIDMAVLDSSSDISMFDAVINMPSLSYRGRAKLQYFGNYLTFEYSRIGPEFKSLANPYLVAGINQFIISDRIQLLKNRVLLTFEYRHQDDDVLTSIANVTNDNRFLTNITILPGPGLPTFTIGYRMNDRENGITELDALVNDITDVTTFEDGRENTKTQNITTSINYVFDAYDSRHTIFGTIVSYDKSDQYSDRELDSSFVDPGIKSNVYNLTANSRFGFIPLKTTVSITTNSSEFSIGPGLRSDQKFTSAKLNVEYGFFNNKVAALGGINYMKGEGSQDVKRLGFRGGVRFRLIEDFTANITVDLRQKTVAEKSASDIIGVAGLSYIF